MHINKITTYIATVYMYRNNCTYRYFFRSFYFVSMWSIKPYKLLFPYEILCCTRMNILSLQQKDKITEQLKILNIVKESQNELIHFQPCSELLTLSENKMSWRAPMYILSEKNKKNHLNNICCKDSFRWTSNL